MHKHKIAPALQAEIGEAADAKAQVEVIVTFRPLSPLSSGDSPSPYPTTEREARRDQNYRACCTIIEETVEDAVCKEALKSALISALVVQLPLNRVEALAACDEVRYIELRGYGVEDLVVDEPVEEEEPVRDGEMPSRPDLTDSMEAARALLASDAYLQEPDLASGLRIGLIDTGLLFDPEPDELGGANALFDTDLIGFHLNCVPAPVPVPEAQTATPASPRAASLQPNPVSPPTDAMSTGHGTCSAAILIANTRQGKAFQGLTRMTVDSFRVYDDDGHHDEIAVAHALEAALLEARDDVLLVEVTSESADTGFIAQLADQAFDAGTVVIAPTGDRKGDGQVRAPANAHKVIGVGGFDIKTGRPYGLQSNGPAPDGRIKPDVVAPTKVRWHPRRRFSGTSGAAPFAAALAALLSRRLRKDGASPHPGHVYAHLILCGDRPYDETLPDGFDHVSGAGRLSLLPLDGLHWWGNEVIDRRDDGRIDHVDVLLEIPDGTYGVLDAALWWPEDAVQPHNHIDLLLYPPTLGGNGGGPEAAGQSLSAPSVFQRAQATGPLTPGSWTLRIRGTDVQAGPQTIYWAAFARPVAAPDRGI